MKKCGRADTCSAGQRLAFDAALVGAKNENAVRHRLGKVGVRAFRGKRLVPAQGRTPSAHVEIFHILDEDDGVWDASVEEVNVEFVPFDEQAGWRTQILRRAHVDGHICGIEARENNASGGFKRENAWHRGEESSGKPGETTGSIATHFRFATVAVVIPHPKIRAVVRRLNREKTVGTDAAMTVANVFNLLGRKSQRKIAIVNENEIVSRSVHF